MNNESQLDGVYANRLLNYPYGWALFKQASAQQLKPGAFGYFDSEGDWQATVQLTDEDRLKEQDWKPVDEPTELNLDLKKKNFKKNKLRGLQNNLSMS